MPDEIVHSRAYIEKVREAVIALDTDHDRRITHTEQDAVTMVNVSSRIREEALKIMHASDTHSDTIWINLPDALARVDQYFRSMDKNNDRQIQQSELDYAQDRRNLLGALPPYAKWMAKPENRTRYGNR